MVKTLSKSSSKIPHITATFADQIGFTPWRTRFFAYLVKEKGSTNPALLELIYYLSDDGREELALSVFNFLRPHAWTDFCQDRRLAKRSVRKSISKAISDLRRARAAYSALLAFSPEIALYRQLGDDRCLHLSDILEQEATFLSAQAGIEGAATRIPELGGKDRAAQSMSLLWNASRELTRAANSYRRLLTIITFGAIGRAFDSFPAAQLIAQFENEDTYLQRVASNVNRAFNNKRLGTVADWSLMIRLQYFVEDFARRWKPYLPPCTTTTLREADIADLLEAGKAALGFPQDATFVDSDSTGRALERFRQNKANQRTCEILKQSAQIICDGLKIRSPQTAA